MNDTFLMVEKINGNKIFNYERYNHDDDLEAGQGWVAGAGAACFWTLGAGAAPTKNTGAGAAKIKQLLYQLLKDKKKHKEIVNLLIFYCLNREIYRKILLYQFFTSVVCRETNIFQNLTNSEKPEPINETESEPLKKNIRSRRRLGTKSGARAAWEKQDPEPQKN